MMKKPQWIKSTIDKDGLPTVKNSDSEENDFAKWLRGGVELPVTGAAMNCWEAVCTAAVLGGLTTRAGLVELFGSTENTANPTQVFLNRLGRNTTDPIVDTSPPPRPGDIILIDNDENVGFHVFIAGRKETAEDLHGDAQGEDFAYSHDKSDSRRSYKYYPNEDAPFGSPFNYYALALDGSGESMVFRNRAHITKYARTGLQHQEYRNINNPSDRPVQIRYLSPTIFKNDDESPFG